MTGSSSSGRIIASPTSTATLDAALATNAQPVPTAVIITPATAGPRMRPVLKMAELMPTALVSSSRPTISTTNDCRTGVSTRGDDAEDGGQREHVPVLHHAGDVEEAEQQGHHTERRLGDEQHPALVQPVGEDAAPEAEQQRRAELQRRDHTERGAGVGEFEDEPVLGDPLHPGAGERDELAAGVEPVVAHAQ